MLNWRFSLRAASKLLLWRDKNPLEISCWGITAEDKPFYIEDVYMVDQDNQMAMVDFRDDALALYRMQGGEGLLGYRWTGVKMQPQRFFRVWIHTHPGDSVTPSDKDLKTLRDSLATIPTSYMMILGKSGTLGITCRVVGEHGVAIESAQTTGPIWNRIDWGSPVSDEDLLAATEQYDKHVHPVKFTHEKKEVGQNHGSNGAIEIVEVSPHEQQGHGLIKVWSPIAMKIEAASTVLYDIVHKLADMDDDKTCADILDNYVDGLTPEQTQEWHHQCCMNVLIPRNTPKLMEVAMAARELGWSVHRVAMGSSGSMIEWKMTHMMLTIPMEKTYPSEIVTFEEDYCDTGHVLYMIAVGANASDFITDYGAIDPEDLWLLKEEKSTK